VKIVIDNIVLNKEMGCRLLKLSHDTCPYPILNDIWDDIVPYTFKEIAHFDNIEERRIGMLCLGLDRLINEVEPELVSANTLKKITSWINANGEQETVAFEDTYELYKVKGSYFAPKNEPVRPWRAINDVYYLQFKDTSTNRRYLLWVDYDSVQWTNRDGGHTGPVTAIQAIAWSITTNVAKGNIEKIIRQGDCILLKPIDMDIALLPTPRHLTADEYEKLLVAES
jgi:hypothetical protein